jgi:hypothetical protein
MYKLTHHDTGDLGSLNLRNVGNRAGFKEKPYISRLGGSTKQKHIPWFVFLAIIRNMKEKNCRNLNLLLLIGAATF